MRKTQSTIAREYLADALLKKPDPIASIQETVQLIRDAQLAALNDGIRIGTEATIQDMQKTMTTWLSLRAEDLHQVIQDFINSFDIGQPGV